MQNSTDLFGKLPIDIQQNELAAHLSMLDLMTLAKTSKDSLKLLKPQIEVSRLLGHVIHGQHEAVESQLKKDSRLMVIKGKVTDCSGRTFENISAFEYALWSLDKHLWTRMIHCIPSNKKGNQVYAELLSQYNNLINTKGVTYKLHGTSITEKHFDFENTIIKTLRTCLDLKKSQTITWAAIAERWESVCKAQMLLPMHVIYEYCSSEPFYPVPTFIRQPVSSLYVLKHTTLDYENWFDAYADPQCYLVVLKGGWGGGRRGMSPFFNEVRSGLSGLLTETCKQDLEALKALYEVRIEDFSKLKQQLSKPSWSFKHLLPAIWVLNRLQKGEEEVPTQCHLQ